MRGGPTKAGRTRCLLASGCREKRGPEPSRPLLPCRANCRLDFVKLIRTQSHPDKFPQSFTLGFLGSANFPGHARSISVTRKLLLHYDNLRVTDIQVSFETLLSSGQVAGTAVGESEPTNSLPVSAGASQIESEMKAPANQVRSLAIEATGDFYRGKVVPKIRITGRWLERAGFKPGHRVEVRFDQPGNLTLRFLEQTNEVAL